MQINVVLALDRVVSKFRRLQILIVLFLVAIPLPKSWSSSDILHHQHEILHLPYLNILLRDSLIVGRSVWPTYTGSGLRVINTHRGSIFVSSIKLRYLGSTLRSRYSKRCTKIIQGLEYNLKLTLTQMYLYRRCLLVIIIYVVVSG